MIESKQHVQVPIMDISAGKKLNLIDPYVYAQIHRFMNNKTKEAFPGIDTLRKISGVADKTIVASIQRLEETGFLSVKREYGKQNFYIFNEYKKFEIFSYEFLDLPDLTPKEKSIMIVLQSHMFKSETNGVITYNTQKIADLLNITVKTLKKYEKKLIEKGILSLVPYKRDNATGIPVLSRCYDFEAFSNSIALKFVEHEQRLDNQEHNIQRMQQRIEELESQLKKLTIKQQAEIVL